MSVFKITSENKKTIPWKLAAIFLLFSVAIILMGIYYYKSQITRVFSEQQNNLEAITALKIGQITQWRNERLGNAMSIKENEPLMICIRQYFNYKEKPEIKEELKKWMETLDSAYDYNSVSLLDTSLNIRLSVSSSDPFTTDVIKNDAQEVIRSKNVIMTDLFTETILKKPYLYLLIPLLETDNNRTNSFGIVILRINPGKILFPLIQSWPTPSKSAETLVVRKEGDSILYLNELRHIKNTSLNLRLPINESHPSSLAVKGAIGFVQGVDYRNVPVVAWLANVPGTPWKMVAKVDKEEIQAPLRRYVFLVVIITTLLILINASVFGFWIWEQRVKTYRHRLKDEIALRESEKKLIESEEIFRKLFENMLNGFAYCKMLYEEGHPPDFLYINVNKAFESLTGLKNVKGKKVTEVIPGIQEGDPELLEKYSRVALTGKPEVFETYVESMKMWFSISVYSPQKEYFVAVFDVITERKLAEAAIRESEDKFKYVFDHSVIGKSITLITGEINVNKAFCDMIGYPREELEQLKWKEISHPDDIYMTQKNLDLLLTGEKNSVRFIKRYIHKNGTVVWADVGTALRRDSDGKPLYFMTAINNITDRKNAESQIKKLNEELEERVILRTAQLEAANKELEAFSYSVSHDLRAPLRSVHGFTKILLEDYRAILDEEGKRIFGIISSSATHMGELIDDLLSFSRVGRSNLNLSEIDMKKMSRSIFEGITSPVERERIKLNIGRLHKAYGDVKLLGQVWTNLISNSIKYSSKNVISEINIGSSVSGKMITYHIKDNGVGFDMQYAHKLFGVFQRLHSETEFEGNGVGLAIIQRIILKHSGKVWAEGEVGKGATFYFSLPV